MPSEAEIFAAEIAAALCAERLRAPGALGAFAERLPPLHRPTFIECLSAAANRPTRVAVLGGGPWEGPAFNGIEITTDPTRANQWRNDAEATSGRACVVLVVGQVAKVNSLRSSVPLVHAEDVRRAAAQRAIAMLDTPERRAFWNTITDDAAVSNNALLEFAAQAVAAARCGQAMLLEREPQLLHHLGLLPDASLLAAGGRTAVERLLRRNRALVARIRRLSDTDRRLVAVVLQDQYAGDAKRAEARAILRYRRTGLFEDLGRLSYENVTAILQPRPHDPGDASRPGGREDGLPPPRPDRLLGDEVALDLLLNHAGRDLGEAARRYGAAVQPGSDEDVAAEVEVGERPIVRRLRNGQSALEIPLARLATADVWGGVVNAPGAVDFVAAVQAMDADDAQVLPFRPADHDQVGEMLERVVERGIADVSALRNWEEYEAARTALLPHVHCLADHPLMALAEAAELRERAGRLITAHANFLEAVRSVAAAMRQRSSFEPAKRLLARALCLDLIFVRSAQDAVAIAAPSHPFHLWRWLAFEELVRDHSEDFRELGVDVLRQLVLDPPPTGPNILVSPHVTELGLEQEAIYVEIGSFGALPVFGDPQSRVTGRFRTDVLTTIANNLIRLAGHARFGLRVALIDPPSVADAVEALLQLPARAGGPVPIHVEIFRTKTGPTASEEEHVQMEGLQGTLEEAGGSVRIHREEMTLAEIAALLAVEAAHLVVVFEPGRGRIYPVGVDAPPALSPLVIPRVYQYDAFDDRFTVVVAADARTFGPYYDVFCEAMSLPQSHFFGQHSGSSDWQADLETLAAQALWIVLVDKSLEPTFHLGHATRLDWRSAGGRDVVTFTMYPGTIEDFVAQVVELAGLIPNDRTVARTSAAMRALGGDTMLMPMGGSSGVPVDPRVAKGLVGTLAAARAISLAQAGALVVSLDDRHSRRWILGAQADDARRSDLLSVRQVEDGVVLTAVEVKTHDDADGTIALVNGRATGRAIQQIDSTIRVLRRIFAGVGATALDKARREILQDQLYRALASRPMERGDRERSVQVLKELFRSGPVRIEGALCKVRIASGAPSALPREPRHSYLTPRGQHANGVRDCRRRGAGAGGASPATDGRCWAR